MQSPESSSTQGSAALFADPTKSASDLPEHLLEGILRTVNVKDLAVVCCTSSALRRLVLPMDVWEELCMKRWPRGDVKVYGSWHRMWASRQLLPASLPTTLDTARYATYRAQSSILQGANESLMRSSLFSTFLESAFTAGGILHLAGTRSIQTTPEYQRLQADAGWWLSEAASTVVAAVRSCHESLQSDGISVWSEVAWRRSALAFLLQFAAATCQCSSTLERISRELAMMDGTMQKLIKQQQEQQGSKPPTAGHSSCIQRKQLGSIPTSHWWMRVGL